MLLQAVLLHCAPRMLPENGVVENAAVEIGWARTHRQVAVGSWELAPDVLSHPNTKLRSY